MMMLMPEGLGVEIPETHHSYLTAATSDPKYSKFQDKIRAWNAKTDLFTLRYNMETNTLEVYDFKLDRDFDKTNPGNHFINSMVQIIIYSLIVQQEIGKEVNIRCILFNKKGFIQFDPNLMFFELLNFLTNFRGSEWNLHLVSQISQRPSKYKVPYSFYKGIKPTDIMMKFFIDFYPLVDKSKIKQSGGFYSFIGMYRSFDIYLNRVESVLKIMRKVVQERYLNPNLDIDFNLF